MKKSSFLLGLALLMCSVLITSLAEVETFISGNYEYSVDEKGNATIVDYDGEADTVVIPTQLDGHSVIAIGDRSFYSCKALSEITLPDSVTSIGDDAFTFCEALSKITLPDSVTIIGDRAFSCCDALSEITLPDSVTSIGDKVFDFCDSLETIILTEGSYAEQYAINEGIPYTYKNANDWLNN